MFVILNPSLVILTQSLTGGRSVTNSNLSETEGKTLCQSARIPVYGPCVLCLAGLIPRATLQHENNLYNWIGEERSARKRRNCILTPPKKQYIWLDAAQEMDGS